VKIPKTTTAIRVRGEGSGLGYVDLAGHAAAIGGDDVLGTSSPDWRAADWQAAAAAAVAPVRGRGLCVPVGGSGTPGRPWLPALTGRPRSRSGSEARRAHGSEVTTPEQEGILV